jgi:flagellar hook-basal body complex protein FliE
MNLKLPPISPTNPQEALSRHTRDDGSNSNSGIGQNFEKLLQEVNQQQLNAETKQVELLTSENKDIHGTMIALEKADISMRLMMQIRNKLVSAYEEVMRMQV